MNFRQALPILSCALPEEVKIRTGHQHIRFKAFPMLQNLPAVAAGSNGHIFSCGMEFFHPLADHLGNMVRKHLSQHIVRAGKVVWSENIAIDIRVFHDFIQVFQGIFMLHLDKPAQLLPVILGIILNIPEAVVNGIHRAKATLTIGRVQGIGDHLLCLPGIAHHRENDAVYTHFQHFFGCRQIVLGNPDDHRCAGAFQCQNMSQQSFIGHIAVLRIYPNKIVAGKPCDPGNADIRQLDIHTNEFFPILNALFQHTITSTDSVTENNKIVNDRSGQRIAYFGHLIDRKRGNWYSEKNKERQAVAVKLTQYSPARAEALRKRNLPGTQLPDMKILWFDTVTADTIERRIYSGSHTHSFYELQLVFDGSCIYECNGETYSIPRGQALLIPSNLSHRYIGCSDSLLKISIAFSLHTAHPVSAILSYAGVRRAEITEAIREATDYMFSQASREDLFLPGILSGRILEILYAICSQWKMDLTDTNRQAPDPRFLVARNYIHQNIRQLLSCEAVAQECGYSAKQLSRIFKSHTGKTLYEYITHARIQEATALLLDSTQSIQQISFLMGFENESSFVSFFKRHCGVTPGNFRKQKSDRT